MAGDWLIRCLSEVRANGAASVFADRRSGVKFTIGGGR